MRPLILICTTVFTVAFTSHALAQAPRTLNWTEIGPYGGSYAVIGSDSAGNIYTVEQFAGGLFRSTDRGASWDEVNALRPFDIQGAADGSLYVLADVAMVSRDSGATFTALDIDTAAYELHHFFIGAGDDVFLMLRARASRLYVLFVSTDRGDQWREVALPAQEYEGGTVDSRGRICLRINGAVWRYDNPEWAKVWSKQGIPATTICRLADGDLGIVSLESRYFHWDSQTGTSQDRGGTGTGPMDGLTMGSDGTLVIYNVVSISISRDGGFTWDYSIFQVFPKHIISVTGVRDDILFSFTGQGLYRTDPRFTSIEDISHGLVRSSPSGIFVTTGGTIIAHSPLTRLAPGTFRWHRTRVDVASLQELPDRRLVSYAGRHVNVSDDGGITWRKHGDDFPKVGYGSMIVGPQSIVAAVTGKGVFEGELDGRGWHRLGAAFAERVTTSSVTPWGQYFIGMESGLRYFDDVSKSWTLSSMPIDTTDEFTGITAPDETNLFVATRKRGLWRSADRGASWSKVGLPDSSQFVRHIIHSPRLGLFAVVDMAIHMSRDIGSTWTAIETPLRAPVNDLAFTGAGDIVVSSAGRVFISRDLAGPNSVPMPFVDVVRPNAIRDEAIMTMLEPAVGTVRVHAANLVGEVIELDCVLSVDRRSVRIDVSDDRLPSGMFLLRVLDDRGIAADARIVKLGK